MPRVNGNQNVRRAVAIDPPDAPDGPKGGGPAQGPAGGKGPGVGQRGGHKHGGAGGAQAAVEGAKANRHRHGPKGGDGDGEAADDAAKPTAAAIQTPVGPPPSTGGGGMESCPMMGGSTQAAANTSASGSVLGAAAAPQVPPAPSVAAPPVPLAATLIDSAAAGTDGSNVAQQVFASLKQGGAKIELMDDAQFSRKYGNRTAGLFDPNTNGIVVPRRVAQEPTKLRLILLHEGVHWLQDNVPGGAEGLGGPIGQALQGAGAVRRTQKGTKADSQHDEAQAYLIEALTANQLGIKDAGLGVDAGGKALGYGAILARVKSTPEYA